MVGLVSGAGFTGLRISSLPFSSSVDFGKLLSFSVPQSPSVKWELQSRVTIRSTGNPPTLRTMPHTYSVHFYSAHSP